ncbi:hypothetical protein L210DRAFT_3644296 [Boletus edulis BED1]|uniref:DUF6533 domain-containing protein n=1 Tax=Boletus edulis BED1 TaxID=1328754 RepID=A0AAD4GFK7_BOLED|nr:hypothetical protein L210DRAFT_3644296 [Boletus edulis BED1]
MSSDVQSVLAQLQLNDYISVVILTAISYDYCLTFSKEIAYIWQRPWTRVSTLFVVVSVLSGVLLLRSAVHTQTSGIHQIRYVGYVSGITTALRGWAYTIFWMSADMVMVLRVYALWNRSKIILGVLLVIYTSEVVILLVSASIYSDPKYAIASVAQILDITVCSFMLSTQTWNIAPATIQCILGCVLCLLVVAKSVRDLLQMYRATRKWQMNRYISLLARDGLFYFLALFLVLDTQGTLGQGLVLLLTSIFAAVVLFTLTPRFVLNVRELYVLDTQGRWDIDAGFGLSSQAGHGVGGSASIGTIAFAAGGLTGSSEEGQSTAAVSPRERAESDDREEIVIE